MTPPDGVVIAGLPAPREPAELEGLEADGVELTAQERRWPRRRVTTRQGRVLTLMLPPGDVLAPGTLLHVGAGWYAAVEAATEPVLAVAPRSAEEAVIVAHAVGNHHSSLAIDGERLLVPDEPQIERLLRRLGVPWLRTRERFAPISAGTPH